MELKRRSRANAEFSMASMTDIIFLLLIFFMITSSAISQSAIQVDLPSATDAAQPETVPISITVNKEGQYFFQNDQQPTPKEQVEQKLLPLLQAGKQKIFSIKADKMSTHGDVVYLMNIAEKNKLGISLATLAD